MGLRDAGFVVIGAEHPYPGEGSLEAGKAVMEAVEKCSGTCIFLLSGGASSLCELNLPEFPRDDVEPLYRALVRSGADITEMNVVRKHVSAIKGGRLAEAFTGERMYTLVISDVMGSTPDVIGSGPTVPDSPGSTFGECRRILKEYDLEGCLSEAGLAFFRSDDGTYKETLKELSGAERFSTDVLMSSELLMETLSDELERDEPELYIRVIPPCELPSGSGLKCEVVARRLAEEIKNAVGGIQQLESGGKKHRKSTLVLFGGEPVVKVTGNGKGGRAQHTALLLLKYVLEDDGFAGWPSGVSMMAFATDGADGNSGAAGCVLDKTLFGRLTKDAGMADEEGRRRVLTKIERYLGNFDSHGFFRDHGARIETGPTGTNVLDVYVVHVGRE